MKASDIRMAKKTGHSAAVSGEHDDSDDSLQAHIDSMAGASEFEVQMAQAKALSLQTAQPGVSQPLSSSQPPSSYRLSLPENSAALKLVKDSLRSEFRGEDESCDQRNSGWEDVFLGPARVLEVTQILGMYGNARVAQELLQALFNCTYEESSLFNSPAAEQRQQVKHLKARFLASVDALRAGPSLTHTEGASLSLAAKQRGLKRHYLATSAFPYVSLSLTTDSVDSAVPAPEVGKVVNKRVRFNLPGDLDEPVPLPGEPVQKKSRWAGFADVLLEPVTTKNNQVLLKSGASKAFSSTASGLTYQAPSESSYVSSADFKHSLSAGATTLLAQPTGISPLKGTRMPAKTVSDRDDEPLADPAASSEQQPSLPQTRQVKRGRNGKIANQLRRVNATESKARITKEASVAEEPRKAAAARGGASPAAGQGPPRSRKAAKVPISRAKVPSASTSIPSRRATRQSADTTAAAGADDVSGAKGGASCVTAPAKCSSAPAPKKKSARK